MFGETGITSGCLVILDSVKTPGRKRSWTDEQLIAAVAECSNMKQVVAALGLSPKGAGNWASVGNHIERLGLSTAHWIDAGWSSVNFLRTRPLDEILVVNSTYRTGHLKERLFRAGLKQRKCESCSLTEWMGQPIPLELDHENGDPADHRIENLRVLCPNCHALTPTWRGRKNKRKDGALAQDGRAAA